MRRNLFDEVKVSQAITPAAGVAGTTAINGSVLDMAGFNSFAVMLTIGVVTAGAVTSFKIQQGDASDLSDADDLEGTSVAIADDDDNEIKYSQIIKPEKRYVRVVVSRATQNAVIAEAHYLQFDPRSVPVSQAAVVSGETHVRPGEGSA